jgi:hypothetical protein
MLVSDLVTDALRKLTVIGQTATPSAEQGQDAVTKLNDVMASLAEDGIDFGYNPKATTAESIELPAGHALTIKAMLILSLAGGYGIEPPAFEVGIAGAGYNRMLARAVYKDARETRGNAPLGERQLYGYDITRGY